MLERPFGAIYGWRGGSGANKGDGFAGLPTKEGRELGPSGIGTANAPGATAKAMHAAAMNTTIRMGRECPGTAPRMRPMDRAAVRNRRRSAPGARLRARSGRVRLHRRR